MFEHLPKKRRDILRAFVAGGVAFFLAPFGYAAAKFLAYQSSFGGSKTAKLSAADLTPDSPSKLVEIEGEPVIVVREADNTIRAFTATCTHLGCVVSFRPQVPGFYCKCHGGKYDVNGVNVPGTPPKSPLTELAMTLQADDIEVTLSPKTSAPAA